MVTRAKQSGGQRPGAAGAAGSASGSGGSSAPLDPATYVPNFSRSPADWRPNGGQTVTSLLFEQLLATRPGRTTFIVVNTGANPIRICNSSTGAGAITVGPSAAYNVDTEGELWAAATAAGGSTVDITETYGAIPDSESSRQRPQIPSQVWGLR